MKPDLQANRTTYRDQSVKKGDILNYFRKIVVPVLLAGIWVSLSEFVRNEFLLKSYWIKHYQQFGLEFPSEPVNGIIWVMWSFLFAAFILVISRKFNLVQTFLLSWFVGFVLLWLVIGNLMVLPGRILVFAIPLSLLEVFVGAYICKRMGSRVSK